MAMRIVSVKFDPVTELTTYILQNTESYSLPGFSINYVLIFVFPEIVPPVLTIMKYKV
jgi:hypothetical protein